MDAAPRLAVVGRAGVGVDNIDVPAATERGVYVVNAPLGNIVAAAEHTIALALALMRKIPEADRSVRAGDWTRSKLIGRELRGKTLGLVGIGRVGSEVARRAAAFEMKVIAHDPFATEASARAAGAQLVELDELFARADVISLHTPLTDKTRGLINAQSLAKMKPTAVLVNASRGEVVDAKALAEAAAAQRAAHCPYAAHRGLDERGAGERRRGCRPSGARHHRRQTRALRGERPTSTGR